MHRVNDNMVALLRNYIFIVAGWIVLLSTNDVVEAKKRNQQHQQPPVIPLTTLTTTPEYNDNKCECIPGEHPVKPQDDDNNNEQQQAPKEFTVVWKTTISAGANSTLQDDGMIAVHIIREWSPIGVDQFYQLLLDNYYNCAAFFRVVPGTLL